MLSVFKDHPFAVEAFFESSLVLTYAVPAAILRQQVPRRLMLDTFLDEWAFIAIAIVKTRGLRPKGFPAFMGTDFILTGYRVFVRYTTPQGKNLRGLYILKSETDKRKMAFLGNLFTHYNYTTTDIQYTHQHNQVQVHSEQSGLHIVLNTGSPAAPLPTDSPFNSWKEARRFAGPLPFTFTCDGVVGKVLVIEGVRENWTPAPVEVLESRIAFLQQSVWQEARLANAFMIQHIPYYWKKGKVDLW
ncbi:DUF2071 domain-containing protein [Chitinophaga sp. 30R24]|uniref:DUF2071 domain-containing protein n=1 Tax=Chitinophaga sp. 30R24 TaxID=3248838 RepID=UPI003B9096EC